MPFEQQHNAERSIASAGADMAVMLRPSNHEMQAHFSALGRSGSLVQEHEQGLFGNGFSFNQELSIYSDEKNILAKAETKTDAPQAAKHKQEAGEPSPKVYKTPEEAAKHAFLDNDLLKKSQHEQHEIGFWIYKRKDEHGHWGYAYSKPFAAKGKMIEQEEWQSHDVPANSKRMVVASGHTHPDKRPQGNANYGFESFSPDDLKVVQEGFSEYIENAYGQIRLRKPGASTDTLVAGPKEPHQSLK
jgi:hypothetical protein